MNRTTTKAATTHEHDYDIQTGSCFCGDVWDEGKQPSDPDEPRRAGAGHTPTPWHRNVSPAWRYPIYADRDGDPDGRDWIHVAAVLEKNPNAEADLNFIIRAVNNFDALVEALNDARESLSRLPDADGAYRVTVIKQIDKALARARQ